MHATTIRSDTSVRHRAKYENRNPLQRLSLGRFHDTIAETIANLAPVDVLDFGCGEAFTLDALAERGTDLPGYEGIDLRTDALEDARSRWPSKRFTRVDLFDPALDGQRYDLVMALQVLEHLYDPGAALARLADLADRALLLTVPDEPWFRLINLARGRDIARLGNHPEHVQHWSPARFEAFVARYAEVVSVQRRFPFIIATARPRR
ncbi:MAG: class I SAM-dependent methyltransferase [Pseudomonadota bacterium]